MGLWPKKAKETGPDVEPQPNADDTWPFNTDSKVIIDAACAGQPLSVMLVDLTGLEWSEIEPLLPTARDVSAKRGMVPVLIVDLVDYVQLRKTDLAYDVLPNEVANGPLQPGLDWPTYLAHRRALLTEKWQPAAIVHLSQHAEGWT